MAQEGRDQVQANEPLLTLETDKVSTEIVAAATGRVTLQVKEGEEVKIGQIVATIEEGPAATAQPAGAAASPAPNKVAPSADPVPAVGTAAKAENLGEAASAKGGGDLPLSPAVQRLVTEGNIAPGEVGAGTGKGGRLTKGDVLAFVENRPLRHLRHLRHLRYPLRRSSRRKPPPPKAARRAGNSLLCAARSPRNSSWRSRPPPSSRPSTSAT